MKQKLIFGMFAALAFLLTAFWGCQQKPTDPGVEGKLAGALTGAIYTTNSGCSGVNVNQFPGKADVYLDGGPQGGGSGLPQGFYYVKVTTPNGDLLGKTNDPSVEVNDAGKFIHCYQLVDILYSTSSGFATKGYDNTTNAGGVYKVWISADPTFPNSDSKTDNFKVITIVNPPTSTAELKACKFYDFNANGLKDQGEISLQGWPMTINPLGGAPQPATQLTGTDGCVTWTSLDVNSNPYNVTEGTPMQSNWTASTLPSVNVTIVDNNTTEVEFGNYCTVPSGGKTLGFWSNKNGQATIQTYIPNWRDVLNTSNLRKANGEIYLVPNSGNFNNDYTNFRTWLLGATATNMAYMLSAQLAAMKLNTAYGFVNGNAFDFCSNNTINTLMASAVSSLGTYNITTSGHPQRSNQEAMKNCLDALNNGASVIPPTPCPYTFAP